MLIRGQCAKRRLAEFEATFYDAPRTGQTLVEIQ
jgi:hypothetical protein